MEYWRPPWSHSCNAWRKMMMMISTVNTIHISSGEWMPSSRTILHQGKNDFSLQPSQSGVRLCAKGVVDLEETLRRMRFSRISYAMIVHELVLQFPTESSETRTMFTAKNQPTYRHVFTSISVSVSVSHEKVLHIFPKTSAIFIK